MVPKLNINAKILTTKTKRISDLFSLTTTLLENIVAIGANSRRNGVKYLPCGPVITISEKAGLRAYDIIIAEKFRTKIKKQLYANHLDTISFE